MSLRDAAPKPAHDAAAIFGLASRARFLIDKFLALPPSQRAQATDLVKEVASIVKELKGLRSPGEHDKH
jgi:hypothetical protein